MQLCTTFPRRPRLVRVLPSHILLHLTLSADGETIHIKELHVLADAALEEGFDKDEELMLLEALRASRELKRIGVRASNVAAAADTRATVAEMQDGVRPSDSFVFALGFVLT